VRDQWGLAQLLKGAKSADDCEGAEGPGGDQGRSRAVFPRPLHSERGLVLRAQSGSRRSIVPSLALISDGGDSWYCRFPLLSGSLSAAQCLLRLQPVSNAPPTPPGRAPDA